MKDREELKRQIWELACGLVREDPDRPVDDKLLHVILSESSQALEFVCILEDEYEVEFDDDEIDLDFFRGFDTIAERLSRHIESRSL